MAWQRKWKEVPVTAEIIAQASRASSTHCMIADAIKAALGVVRVSVDLQTIRFSDSDKGERYVYLTPDPAQVQLLRFDQGVVVEPWILRLPTRPSQITPITSRSSLPNRLKRPLTAGKKEVIVDNRLTRVSGGEPPPLGLLAHSPYGRKGVRRVFGIKAAGKYEPAPGRFNPTV